MAGPQAIGELSSGVTAVVELVASVFTNLFRTMSFLRATCQTLQLGEQPSILWYCPRSSLAETGGDLDYLSSFLIVVGPQAPTLKYGSEFWGSARPTWSHPMTRSGDERPHRFQAVGAA